MTSDGGSGASAPKTNGGKGRADDSWGAEHAGLGCTMHARWRDLCVDSGDERGGTTRRVAAGSSRTKFVP